MQNTNIAIPHADTVIDVEHLRDIEIAILCSSIESKESFKTITSQLHAECFTFLTLKLIYESVSEVCMDMEHFNKDIIIEEVINYAKVEQKISEKSFRDILNNAPSKMLDIDIAEVKHFYQQKILHYGADNKKMFFEFNEDTGKTVALYIDGRLFFISTTDIFSIPKEIEDVQYNTLQNTVQVNIETLTVEVDQANPDYVERFIVNR